MEDTEREDLDALVNHPGWARFCQYVAREWGNEEGNGLRFMQGVKDAANDLTSQGPDKLRQVIVAQREIQTLLSWPRKRMRELSPRPELAVSGSRRGSL